MSESIAISCQDKKRWSAPVLHTKIDGGEGLKYKMWKKGHSSAGSCSELTNKVKNTWNLIKMNFLEQCCVRLDLLREVPRNKQENAIMTSEWWKNGDDVYIDNVVIMILNMKIRYIFYFNNRLDCNQLLQHPHYMHDDNPYTDKLNC